MNRLAVSSLVSFVFIMAPAMAQQPPDPSKPSVTTQASPSGAPTDPNLTVATVKMQDGLRISNLIGSFVYNDQNEKVGSLDDLIMKDGHTIVMAVVSVGGFLGIGNKLVAVPYEQLHPQMDQDGTKVTLPGASKDALNTLPIFTYSG